MKKVTLILAAVALIISTNLFAQRTTDIEGSKDYPFLSRFEGSIIQYYNEVKWDDYQVPLSKVEHTEERGRFFEKMIAVEGKVIRIQYTTSSDNNTAFVYKNYEAALKKAKYSILFQGKGDDELGESSQYFCRTFYENMVEKFGYAYNPKGETHGFIVAKTKKDSKNIYVIVYISGFADVTLITQDVVEEEVVETGAVTAQTLDEGISSTGHTTLEGVYFDTGKSTIKLESVEALKIIAEYLNAHADKKFLIVGHTDNVGNFDANIKLSTERAISVTNELATKYGVKTEQLNAFGAGSTSPIASNSTEEGKTKNRRVEIVEQ